jgi:hypothetical protein
MSKNKLPAPVKCPFDLPKTPPRFHVFVNPKIAAVMELADDEGGSEIERETIQSLYPLLVESSPGKWSFSLPHHYGLKDREKKAVEKAFNTQLEIEAQTLELFSRIAKETGKTTEDIVTALQQNPSKLIEDPIYAPYAVDAMRVGMGMEQKDVPYDTCVATVHMQRVIPEWKLDNTKALHDHILGQLVEFGRQEEILASTIDKDEPGEALGAEASKTESTSSEDTSLLTGTQSDMTLNTGESEI